MRICDDLRQAVLQAAIQGKLTKQLPEDGNAADLLKHKHPLTNDEEKPFELPSSWIWVRLGDIGSFTRGSGIKRNEVTSEGFPCIRYGQLYTTYHNKIGEVLSKTSETVFKKSKKIKHGDIVMALTGENNYDIALAAAYIGHDTVAIGGDMTAFAHNVNPLYLVIAINSPYGIKCKSKLATGNIIVHISNDKLASIPVPLPPVAEQHRIVARVEELMARIDDLEKTETELEKLKAAFPGDMKAALLQAAMQGKLTEQLPGENLNEIKSSLVYDKKLDSFKEAPFDIPNNWEWIQIGNLGQSTDTNSFSDGPFGSNLKREHQIDKHEVRIIQLSNIGETGWKNDNEKYTSFKHLDEVIPRCEVQVGDFVIAKMMPAGRTIEVPDLGTRITLGSDAMKFKPNAVLNKQYLLYAMRSQAFLSQVYADAHGITRVRTTLKGIKSYAIPIPPLAEQKRIVEKLDKLLPLCDGLVEE